MLGVPRRNPGTSGSSAFLDAGFAGKCERALGSFERELRNTHAEHGSESVLGPLEEFVGLAVALLGVLQMRAQSFELVREFFQLFFHSGEAFQQALGIFFHLHAAKAHGDNAEMGVKGIGGHGDDFFIAAVGIQGLSFAVFSHEQFVVDALGRDEHQRDIERAFLGHDVFFADGVGMALHRSGEGPAHC